MKTYNLPEDFTISSIEAVKNDIDNLFADTDELMIEGKKIKSIDITGVQLFYALKKLASQQSKKININISLEPDAEAILGKAGFNINNI